MKLIFGMLAATALSWGQAPSVAVFQQVLEKQLLALRPTGSTERQVLFQEVKAGVQNGNAYPFSVTGLIRDYGPGYPANRFYGDTCIGRMEGWIFQLTRNAMGDWQAEGRMTPTAAASKCEKNPAAGVSSIPLASLHGSRAVPTPIATSAAPAQLHIGQWACYGTGGRLLAGLAFYLQADGSYLDGDKKPSGRWSRDVAAATLTFRGGPMDGQIGKDVTGQGMKLTSTVSCEPWR